MRFLAYFTFTDLLAKAALDIAKLHTQNDTGVLSNEQSAVYCQASTAQVAATARAAAALHSA